MDQISDGLTYRSISGAERKALSLAVIWASVESLLTDEHCSTKDTSYAFMGVATLGLAGIKLDPLWRMVASIENRCTAYEWEYAVDNDRNAYRKLPDLIVPDKFGTMSCSQDSLYTARTTLRSTSFMIKTEVAS